jgi:hypothetical protein
MQDRHTKAMRPRRRRLHVEVADTTRDWLTNLAGRRGWTLGRAVDELVAEARDGAKGGGV